MKDGKGAWMAWSPKDDVGVSSSTCSMGNKCTEETLQSVVVERTKDIVWFHMRVQFTLRQNYPRERDGWTEEHDVVIGCKTAPALSCAAVTASSWNTSRATIRGTTVTTQSEDPDGKPHVDVTTVNL
jgi:hypothetical protein